MLSQQQWDTMIQTSQDGFGPFNGIPGISSSCNKHYGILHTVRTYIDIQKIMALNFWHTTQLLCQFTGLFQDNLGNLGKTVPEIQNQSEFKLGKSW